MKFSLQLVKSSEGRIDGIVWRTEPPPAPPYDTGDLNLLEDAVEALRNAHQASLANQVERLMKRLARRSADNGERKRGG